MQKFQFKNKILSSFAFVGVGFMILSFSIFNYSNQVVAAGKFNVQAKINLKSLNHPAKVKVVASANG
jgi:hypothetical protein